jgi:hypothetical protein
MCMKMETKPKYPDNRAVVTMDGRGEVFKFLVLSYLTLNSSASRLGRLVIVSLEQRSHLLLPLLLCPLRDRNMIFHVAYTERIKTIG